MDHQHIFKPTVISFPHTCTCSFLYARLLRAKLGQCFLPESTINSLLLQAPLTCTGWMCSSLGGFGARRQLLEAPTSDAFQFVHNWARQKVTDAAYKEVYCDQWHKTTRSIKIKVVSHSVLTRGGQLRFYRWPMFGFCYFSWWRWYRSDYGNGLRREKERYL